MNRGINCHLLGHCRQCDGPYKSAYVADGLCPACQADEDRMYQNVTAPHVETPWQYSRSAMRERLGVSGNEDV